MTWRLVSRTTVDAKGTLQVWYYFEPSPFRMRRDGT